MATDTSELSIKDTLGRTIDYDTWTFGNHTYKKPGNVRINYVGSGKGSTAFAESGGKMMQALRTDLSLSARYMAVSAKIGASFAYEGTFSEDKQYGFINNSEDLYIAAVAGNQLFEFTVTCSKTATDDKVTLKACVEAEYGAVVGGIKGQASVEGSNQWQTYGKSRETKVTIVGGYPQHQGALRLNPTDQALAQKWASGDRGLGYEALVHMDTMPLGDLLIYSKDTHERDIGHTLNEYINYRVGARRIPRSKDGYGPGIVAWSPEGGVGHVTIRFKSDPQARFTDI
ncbi:hypothetical protein E8E12_002070 [Didymella heteroderae]|uniref:Uncharacterized protein n=1 Tax=Didymella heteroderae TaxID=1769908 RepID=A0A9P5BYD0_9PLEO|nr:hypothetical protein E8E12_002070 [Didymella heteroderae]